MSAPDMQATERASEADRLWFASHPDRHFRVREFWPGEVPGGCPCGEPWSGGHLVIVEVTQMSPGVRVRWAKCYGALVGGGEA